MTDENTNTTGTPENGAEQGSQVQFVTQRIYVKDVSFESPNGLLSVQGWQPKVNQDLNTKIERVDENLFEVVLNLTVTVTQDDKTAFLVEVQQAGLFTISGLEGQQLQHALSSHCPTILFPFAREAVDNLAVRGGYPPIMLPPINFDALYAQAVAEAKNQSASQGEAAH